MLKFPHLHVFLVNDVSKKRIKGFMHVRRFSGASGKIVKLCLAYLLSTFNGTDLSNELKYPDVRQDDSESELE